MKEERVFLEDLTKVFDTDFLYHNAYWSGTNDGEKTTVFHNNKINEWFYLNNDTLEIKKFSFDNIHIFSMHGYGGTSFTPMYYLGNDITDVDFSYLVAPTIDMLKERKIQKLQEKIDWIDGLQKKKKSLFEEIEKVKNLK